MRRRIVTLTLMLAALAVFTCAVATTSAADAPPKPDPYAATAHLRFGVAPNISCGSATIIGPRRLDGRWDVLTAAHCVTASKGVLTLRDGTVVTVVVSVQHPASDLAWLVTESTDFAALPFAMLAEADPDPGVRIWQAGWGYDKPGVRKYGIARGHKDAGGVPWQDDRLTMRLSVSGGDSGGGIFRVDTGELVSACCSTTKSEEAATAYGGLVSVARRLRPQ